MDTKSVQADAYELKSINIIPCNQVLFQVAEVVGGEIARALDATSTAVSVLIACAGAAGGVHVDHAAIVAAHASKSRRAQCEKSKQFHLFQLGTVDIICRLDFILPSKCCFSGHVNQTMLLFTAFRDARFRMWANKSN